MKIYKPDKELEDKLLAYIAEKKRKPNYETLQSKKYYSWDLKKRLWDAMVTAGMMDFENGIDIESMMSGE